MNILTGLCLHQLQNLLQQCQEEHGSGTKELRAILQKTRPIYIKAVKTLI
jgi:hypothetical protein